MTWAHPSRNPVSGRTLQRARMVIGNEVTLWQLSRMAWSRCQPYGLQGGILQEAKASGKARGYADVETVTGKVKQRVANEVSTSWITLHHMVDATRRSLSSSAAKADLPSMATTACTHDKGSVTEEPYARKRASTVLKQRCEGRPSHRL